MHFTDRTLDVPQRPILHERPDYKPAYAHEEFMVPVLRECIERALATYAASAAAGARVLDVGCGRQPFRKTLEAMGYEYDSTDAQQSEENSVRFVCAIDESLPQELLERGPFQFICCTEVMEHVADWDKAFGNFARLLAPGGRILITCPHFFPLHEEPYDFWRPTLHSLGYFAHRVGFRTCFEQKAGDGWDLIGTALAAGKPQACQDGVLAAVLTWMVDISRKGLWVILRLRFIQKFVSIRTLYISNVVVYEQP
jgi:SAM-dependent methyltransferase